MGYATKTSGEKVFIPSEMHHDLTILDGKNIGNPLKYIGLAYFWNHEYRHELRDASDYQKRLVHRKWCEAGLEMGGVSDAHLAIIKRYVA